MSDFSRVFATLMDKLSNTNSPEEFVRKLVELAETDTTYLSVFARLGGNLSTKSIDFANMTNKYDVKYFTQFYNLFSKQKPETLIQYINDERLIAIAINRLGITLNFLELYDDAEKKLFDAQKFILKNEFEDKNLILANNYQFLSDLYTHTENYKKAIYYIKKAIPEYDKIKDPIQKQKQKIKGYGNIGLQYLSIDLDSAAYYFNKSLSLQDTILIKNYNVSNYVGLGEVYNKKGEYKKSIEYLKKAEELNLKVEDSYYMTSIYDLLQDSYKKIGNTNEHNKYKVLYLENLQKENSKKLEGVNAIVKETKKESLSVKNANQRKNYVVAISILIAILSVGFMVYFVRNFKYKKLEKEEIQKTLVLKEKQLENLEGKVSDLLHEVIDLAKENSTNFYPRFLDLYPDFENKLLDINPKLTNSELEFCAFLRLNFSSKEIANYTFISVRTVQNKKYRLRNKLKIPNETDTYVFFNNM
jgi:tetratricopeptide (TPR) repeat protein